MTAIEFRHKMICELEELLQKLITLDETTFSPEIKDRFSRTYRRQAERLTAVLDSPALARLCSGSKPS
jgi:hypothetical protein